jgi:hypothetical protein
VYKVFIASLITLIVLLGTLAVSFAAQNTDRWIRYTNAECVKVYKVFPYAVIKIADCGKTLDDFKAHAKSRMSLLKSISERHPDAILKANINFRRHLDPEEALKIVEDYNLTVTSYTIIYVNLKGEYLEMHSGLVEDFKKLKSKLLESIPGAKIKVNGFIVEANATTLIKLQGHDLVFLVDPGPIDMVIGLKALGYKYIDMRWIHPPGYILTHAYWLLNMSELPKIS